MDLGPNVIVLTWDCELQKSQFSRNLKTFFLPRSTWAEGRNFLLKKALEEFSNVDYFVFLDDDVEFVKSSMLEFEQLTRKFQPKISVPLCDRIIREMSFSRAFMEHPIRHDQILIAFHQSVVNEGIVLPLNSNLDSISWWITAELQHYLIQIHYFSQLIRFNEIRITNANHNHGNIDPNQSSNSLYHPSFSQENISSLKHFIVTEYGHQKKLLDTIFEPRFLKKARLTNLNSLHVRHLINFLVRGQYVMVFKLFTKIICTLLINVFYRIFLPNQILSSKLKA